MSKESTFTLVTDTGEPLVTDSGDSLSVSIEQMVEAAETASNIPHDAKKAVKDFIHESFNEIISTMSDLSGLEISPELLAQFPDFLEYIEIVIRALS